MALIECPDCSKQVSSNAPACPNCGAPIATALGAQPTSANAPPRASAPEVQTIQQTSKFWKLLQLTGALMVVGSCGSRCIAGPNDPSYYSRDWVWWFFGGIALFVVAKVFSWWHHG
jgi:hypothetical protein